MLLHALSHFRGGLDVRLFISVLFSVIIWSSQVSAALSCPDFLGRAVLGAAWPTPKYTKCTWDIEDIAVDLVLIRIRSYGESAISLLPDKEVWVDVAITAERKFAIKSIEWGQKKAIFPTRNNFDLIIDAFRGFH
jgi:hypothetical protein